MPITRHAALNFNVIIHPVLSIDIWFQNYQVQRVSYLFYYEIKKKLNYAILKKRHTLWCFKYDDFTVSFIPQSMLL